MRISLKKDIIDDFLHQSVEQSKSLTSFLQTLWSRLPGDPALLAFLEPGVDISFLGFDSRGPNLFSVRFMALVIVFLV